MKVMSFVVFGVGTSILGFPVLPVLMLVCHPVEKFQKNARRLVSASFRFFIGVMRCMGIVEFETQDREFFNNLKSKIIVANHPSLLDMVMILSVVPNADVIVKAYARNTVMWGVIKRLYILNSLNFEELTAACKNSLEKGNCLVIFPEGTRTRRGEKMHLKKGAARISILTGTEVVVAHIGGTDKYGLGKKDPFFSFNHTEKYIYRLSLQKIINPEQYNGLEIQIAAKRMNTQILEVFQNMENS
ncbi:MAG: 1-acyl-sn-glycerol-3-phosphate acyltransferase [Treponema sp.]|jgi:1-acyl-sn-glycerol-3-phosphate acyltransferase|nr:1-acyl-sn-glycerol-3-phosphate acyltransferase [Treponema sp.]